MTELGAFAIALPTELLKLGDLAFIDVETTGGRPLEDRLTEVAIIRFAAEPDGSRCSTPAYPSRPKFRR